MEPFEKKGNLVGYSKSSKSYIIQVSGQSHIEVNRDVAFHEEVTFKQSKDIQCDTYMEENETHMMEDPNFDSPRQIWRGRRKRSSQIHQLLKNYQNWLINLLPRGDMHGTHIQKEDDYNIR